MTNTTNKLIALCIGILAVLLITTQPDRLPSWLLILPFAIIFIIFFLLIKSWFQKTGRVGKNIGLVMLLAAFPVVLLALQSLGQLTIRDFATILALFILVYFYIY